MVEPNAAVSVNPIAVGFYVILMVFFAGAIVLAIWTAVRPPYKIGLTNEWGGGGTEWVLYRKASFLADWEAVAQSKDPELIKSLARDAMRAHHDFDGFTSDQTKATSTVGTRARGAG